MKDFMKNMALKALEKKVHEVIKLQNDEFDYEYSEEEKQQSEIAVKAFLKYCDRKYSAAFIRGLLNSREDVVKVFNEFLYYETRKRNSNLRVIRS